MVLTGDNSGLTSPLSFDDTDDFGLDPGKAFKGLKARSYDIPYAIDLIARWYKIHAQPLPRPARVSNFDELGSGLTSGLSNPFSSLVFATLAYDILLIYLPSNHN